MHCVRKGKPLSHFVAALPEGKADATKGSQTERSDKVKYNHRDTASRVPDVFYYY